MITYTPTPTGQYVELAGPLGKLCATIHRPHERRPWRLCYGGGTGNGAGLQGKVIDSHTLRELKAVIETHHRALTEEV